jgi:hypothetical protein
MEPADSIKSLVVRSEGKICYQRTQTYVATGVSQTLGSIRKLDPCCCLPFKNNAGDLGLGHDKQVIEFCG